MNKLLIHNDNVFNKTYFEFSIKFPPIENISKNIIKKIENMDVDIIFIKDNLSSNYLELIGLRVAYHIRLSNELGDKKYLPIIIISDIDSYSLNKIDSMARILFTKNIFIVQNDKESIESFDISRLKPLSQESYLSDFLSKIEVEAPKDYLSHHSIANEWSMYRWAEYLDVNTSDIKKIREDISSMLYFKYLQAKFPIQKSLFAKHKQQLNGNEKVLYIDDEWKKGWKSIFEHIFQEDDNCHLETVEEIYKDKTQEEIISFVMETVISFNPDVVILDMRLHEDDFSKDTALADFTGIQIFNKIKELNPGIQVIIFTASSNSLLLDELYSYDESILGYIKKEHPENYNLTTQGNINRLINFTNKGFENKYLKNIWKIQEAILTENIFNKENNNIDELKNIISTIFEILSSSMPNKINFSILAIFKCFEVISKIYIDNNLKFYSDGNAIKFYKIDLNVCIIRDNTIREFWYKSEENKLHAIAYQQLILKDEIIHEEICKLTLCRNNIIHPKDERQNNRCDIIRNPNQDNIIDWFSLLFIFIKKMSY